MYKNMVDKGERMITSLFYKTACTYLPTMVKKRKPKHMHSIIMLLLGPAHCSSLAPSHIFANYFIIFGHWHNLIAAQ